MAETSSTSVKPNVDQIGIVVRDLHGMVATLKQLLGIEDFRIMEWPVEGIDPEATYHGEPGNFKLLLGFATIGNTQLEIVQPLEGQNIYSDFLEEHGPGLHHFRLTVPDFDERVEDLKAKGIQNIASGTGVHVGSRWAYFDTSKELEGVIVELRKSLDGSGGQGQWIVKD
ncbi:MAG: hypothetical protein BGO78_10655 [Chloroflexi bacterium 44-23]|nr:MAG: hypothetical protein BGO78_10655 [Chloroflexi bacterium 44-23]